jgi:hypothetical protein
MWKQVKLVSGKAVEAAALPRQSVVSFHRLCAELHAVVVSDAVTGWASLSDSVTAVKRNVTVCGKVTGQCAAGFAVRLILSGT